MKKRPIRIIIVELVIEKSKLAKKKGIKGSIWNCSKGEVMKNINLI